MVPSSPRNGRLVCVGVGMTLGSHLTPLARSEIENADVVFAGVSDSVVELWIRTMHGDVRSLQPYYREGKSRRETYAQMVDAILVEVRAGKRVCGVFYGHPGIFALAPHQSIEIARQEGYEARMEPGISSEDCLYADLGVDPGTYGCQHFEATQFLLHARNVDPSAWLFLWQVGQVGDLSLGKLSTGAAHRQVLVDVLARQYPLGHRVVIYKAPTLPIETATIRHVRLRDLPETDVSTSETLAIPPAVDLVPDMEIRKRLHALAIPA